MLLTTPFLAIVIRSIILSHHMQVMPASSEALVV